MRDRDRESDGRWEGKRGECVRERWRSHLDVYKIEDWFRIKETNIARVYLQVCFNFIEKDNILNTPSLTNLKVGDLP